MLMTIESANDGNRLQIVESDVRNSITQPTTIALAAKSRSMATSVTFGLIANCSSPDFKDCLCAYSLCGVWNIVVRVRAKIALHSDLISWIEQNSKYFFFLLPRVCLPAENRFRSQFIRHTVCIIIC